MTPIAPLITAFLREHMPQQRGYSAAQLRGLRHQLQAAVDVRGRSAEDAAVAACAGADRRRDGARVPRPHRAGSRQQPCNAQPAARRDQGVHALRRAPAARARWSRLRRSIAIPGKRHDQKLIRHLTMAEVRAILDAPDAVNAIGHPRPGDAAPVLRRRLARLRTGRADA